MTEFIFGLITLGIIILPIMPGILELAVASDIKPLKVVQEYDVDVTHFAKGFRTFLQHAFPSLAQLAAAGGMKSTSGTLENNTPYQLVGHGLEASFDPQEMRANKTGKLIVATDSISLPRQMSFETEVYSAGWIKSLGGNSCLALLAEGDISLAENSMVVRWVHSERTLYVGSGTYLYGRASAAQKIVIATNCQFERLSAPQILFGQTTVAIQSRDWSLNRPLNLFDICKVKDYAGRRWLVRDDVEIPAGTVFDGDIVSMGNITLKAGCHIIGSVKSNGSMFIEEGVRVDGSVFSAIHMHIELGCQISGPVVAERELIIKTATTIGSESIPTSVSAARASIAPGVIVFGSVWVNETAAVNSEGEFTI